MSIANVQAFLTGPPSRPKGRSVGIQRARSMLAVLLLLAAAAGVGCGGTSAKPQLPPASQTPDDGALGRGDIFEVRVYGEKELSAWSPTGEPRFNVPAKLGKVWSK